MLNFNMYLLYICVNQTQEIRDIASYTKVELQFTLNSSKTHLEGGREDENHL